MADTPSNQLELSATEVSKFLDKNYFWQWEREDGNWIPYTAETSIVLERAYRKKKEVLFTTFGRSNYTMDLHNMVQINNKTKYRRGIMRKESSRGPSRRSEQVKEGEEEEENTVQTMDKDSGRDKEGMLLRWEWEDEHSSWNIYSPEISRDITLAFREGLSSVTVYLNTTTSYHLDLWRMVQQDVHTGSEKRVRVALEDRGSYYIWQWEGDDGSWIPCSAQTSVTLEAAHRSDMKTIVMAFGSTQYTLDLARMVQINNKTKFRRKLRRKELGQDDCFMVSKQADNSFPEILQVFGAFGMPNNLPKLDEGTNMNMYSSKEMAFVKLDYEDPESRTMSVAKLSSVHHRTRMNWTVDETLRLLNFISSRKQWDVYTPSNKGNGAFFKLASEHLKAGGYKKSGIQCRAKWKVLKRQYLTAVQLYQTGKVSSVKMPPFYSELKKMFDSAQHTGTSEMEYSSDEDCEQMGSPSPHSSEPGPAMLSSNHNDTEEHRQTVESTIENTVAAEEAGHADSDADCDGMIESHEGMSSNDGTVVLQRMDMLIDGMNTLNQSVTTLNQCMNSLVRGVQNISRTSLAHQSILQQLLDIFKNGHQPVTPRGTPKLGQ
ncbi:uncharacterized protein LOC122790579 [Protopterus annectens]|uniref:uncharacterized protein LOC122790579 n=1 Tax=Protopterus annectens TaxID=7888 RepID=UPI001CF973BC|nr:uncharacterized protein LOC122790579 [Protopterus annectens]